ncbi:MAG: hypothetical protein WDZ80_06625 [Candidatus Paceibacterota bacterium]
MESVQVIQIGLIESVIGIIVVLVAIGKGWGKFEEKVESIGESIKKIKPDLEEVRERFSIVESRVSDLWADRVAPANSPRELNDRGNDILNKSGMLDIINKKKDILLQEVKKRDFDNAYDAERIIMSVVLEMDNHCPEVVADLKEGAYRVGTDVDTLLYVGGIHLRNLIFTELNLKKEDIDKEQGNREIK